ncbi:hypothetical protein WLZ34_02555 [Thermogladius sp. KZ2Tp1]|uniref:hypothetical protein n=1 Tax=Thermogladius sp. KZ2Tp1 TaxID=3136289 RepID=UPI003DA8504F
MKVPLIAAFTRCCLGELLLFTVLVSSIIFMIQLFFTPVVVIVSGLSSIVNAPPAQPASVGVLLANECEIPLVVYCPSVAEGSRGGVEMLASTGLLKLLQYGGEPPTRLQAEVKIGPVKTSVVITGSFPGEAPALKPVSGCNESLHPLSIASSSVVREFENVGEVLVYFALAVLLLGSLLLGLKREDDLANTAQVIRELGGGRGSAAAGLLLSIAVTAVTGALLGFSLSIALSRTLTVVAKYLLKAPIVVSPYINLAGFARSYALIAAIALLPHTLIVRRVTRRVYE